jgi:hypothetical protein
MISDFHYIYKLFKNGSKTNYLINKIAKIFKHLKIN